MDYLIILIIIGTSIWVYFDAKSIGVKKGQITGIANMGPLGWFFVCLFLWIIGFPVYLAKRGEFKRINSSQPSKTSGDSLTQLEKLAEMKDKGILTEDEFNRKKQELLK
ncbi:MAG: hypothetical protein FD159_2026 [Syntrophaceae bacterium]|nr:MAG: hypothetical protein FD159_2026 [Syntrophaceae bacterium]